MKCDNCGRIFPAHEAVQDAISEQIDTPSRTRPTKTQTIPVTLCQDCAHRRQGTLWFFVLVFFVFLVALILLGLATR